MKTSSLATKLIVCILSSTAIIFLAAFLYNYTASKQTILAEVAENAQHLTYETAYKIEVVLHSVEKIPRNLAAVIEDYPYQQKDLLRLIQSLVAGNRDIYGVAIAYEPYAFDRRYYYFAPYCWRQGQQIKTMFLGSDSYRYFYMDWYQIPRELNRPQWSEPYFDEGAGNIIMSTYSMPFYRQSGGNQQFLGVVTADLSLMWLKDLVSAVKIYQTGYAFLLSQNGVFVTHPDPKMIMRESIFSIAEARKDPELRRIGRSMIRGGSGLVPLTDFFTQKKSWMFYAPLPSTGWSLGVIFPEDELFAGVNTLSHKILLIGLLGLVFLAVAITAISRGITRPLRVLAQKTEAIAQGDFTASVPETGAREICHLAQSFNQMGRQLTDYIEKRDFIRDTFGRYVTQEVVKRLLESQDALALGGETREVSIIMSDLRGFTALTADMDPEDVITFLNRYLGKMIEILIDYRAVIDEIVGDGILAFFGAPEPLENHPAQAVACALKMQQAMEEINALNEADGLPHLEMGIAVNTGAVVVGNIGSEKRTKYSVVGAHVNLTSRIEAYALGGQVLISPSTYERLRDLVEVHSTIAAQMKGVPGTATIYEVGGIGGPFQLRLPDRSSTLVPLPQKIEAKIFRITDKIVTEARGKAWLTQVGETSGVLLFEGELGEWEDIRVTLFDERRQELPGKIYGKVTTVKPGGEGLREICVSFTSVAPEIYRFIRELQERGGRVEQLGEDGI